MSARQLEVGLRVSDLERSATLYRRLGFETIPDEAQPALRYLTYGHTWLILWDRFEHGYHEARPGGPRPQRTARGGLRPRRADG